MSGAWIFTPPLNICPTTSRRPPKHAICSRRSGLSLSERRLSVARGSLELAEQCSRSLDLASYSALSPLRISEGAETGSWSDELVFLGTSLAVADLVGVGESCWSFSRLWRSSLRTVATRSFTLPHVGSWRESCAGGQLSLKVFSHAEAWSTSNLGIRFCRSSLRQALSPASGAGALRVLTS
jgi:hypothetical protein